MLAEPELFTSKKKGVAVDLMGLSMLGRRLRDAVLGQAAVQTIPELIRLHSTGPCDSRCQQQLA